MADLNLENQGVIKGRLFVRDMIRLAKRLADVTKDSASVQISAWHHKGLEPNGGHIEIDVQVWDAAAGQFEMVSHGDLEFFDLREVGVMVDRAIQKNYERGVERERAARDKKLDKIRPKQEIKK